MHDILRPMLASLADPPLADPQLVYEPKYDGIRAIVEVSRDGVRLWSRLGNEKTRQFPEIVSALHSWARRHKEPVVLDGEIVALDGNGEPIGFQNLQGRIHLLDVEAPSRASRGAAARAPAAPPGASSSPVAFIAFDILRKGSTDLRGRRLLDRRAILERVFGKTGSPLLRLSEMVRGDGNALFTRAHEKQWEGLIAKHADSLYKSGKRTPDWRKKKITHEQEFVVGGWTEPRHTRSYFGALLLGVYEPGTSKLIYVGHTGTGFDERELARVMKLLTARETKACPFSERPKTNERPHWAKPELVAQIRFTEWTADAKLRHPVYLGLRDDKNPEEVVREVPVKEPSESDSESETDRPAQPRNGTHDGRRTKSDVGARSKTAAGRAATAAASKQAEAPSPRGRTRPNRASRQHGTAEHATPSRTAAPPITAADIANVVDQLTAIEASKRDGVLALPDGGRLNVTNLTKVFWPKQKLTKGDLFRYYARVAPFIVPAVADRPLVMKRYPNGIGGQWFYQHRVDNVPAGVRTQLVSVAEKRVQIIGGSLATLLYTTQIAAISQDPWFSRVEHPQFADYVALDLDPADGVPFERVLDVARWIRDELDALGAVGVPKTSGSSGVHVYIPLPPGTPYDAGLLFCQIVATVVAQKHPKVATVERAVAARGRRVYVDFLQNILGKTLATAYSARASDYAGVSTPLTWGEVDEGFAREDFTIQTVPARLAKTGDLWARLRRSKGVDLSRVMRYVEAGR